jgi:signal peptidase II
LLGVPVPLRRDLWIFASALAIIVADQATKWAIARWLERGDEFPAGWPIRLVHITNSGAAFGILQDSGPLLVIVSFVGIAAILIYLLNPGFVHPLMRFGLALMFAGAVGNFIDRVRDGEVIDFIKFPSWPAFNVADSAITIGVLCLIWAILFDRSDQQSEESS